MKYKKQIIYFLIACFFLFSGKLNALGLHLYSYINDEGQTIIVSAENKIPLKYRDTAKKKFIKTYTSKKKSITKKIEKPVTTKAKPTLKANSKILVEPIAPVVDVMASASLLLTKLSTFQENSERLQMLAIGQGRKVVEARIRNSQNNRLLTEIKELSNIKFDGKEVSECWEGLEKWISASHQLLKLMQNLQWSANHWMQSGNISLIQNRSELLQQSRFELERLRTTFPDSKVK